MYPHYARCTVGSRLYDCTVQEETIHDSYEVILKHGALAWLSLQSSRLKIA